MNWQDKKIKLYMEAGLALLLVLTLGLAGLTGLLSAGAEENTRQGVTASGEDGTEETDSEETGASAAGTVDDDTADTGGEKAASADGEEITEGQYPIMGESSVTVQEMVDYFNESGEEYPAEELGAGGADSIGPF